MYTVLGLQFKHQKPWLPTRDLDGYGSPVAFYYILKPSKVPTSKVVRLLGLQKTSKNSIYTTTTTFNCFFVPCSLVCEGKTVAGLSPDD